MIKLPHSLLLLCTDRRIPDMRFVLQRIDGIRMKQIFPRLIRRWVWTLDILRAWYNVRQTALMGQIVVPMHWHAMAIRENS